MKFDNQPNQRRRCPAMRIEGRWLRGADGIERPVLDGYLAVPGGFRLALSFLIDTGADSTVLAPDVAQRLAGVAQPTPATATPLPHCRAPLIDPDLGR